MARVPYVEPEQFPGESELLGTHLEHSVDIEEYRTVHEAAPENPERHIYQAIGNNPDLLRFHREVQNNLWEALGLDDRTRELVILATAAHTRAEYEWQAHVPVALDEGFTREEIVAISRENHSSFPEHEQALLSYVGAVIDRAVDGDMHDRIATHYDDEEIIAICWLAGFYALLSSFIVAVDLDTERPFFGWELESLPL